MENQKSSKKLVLGTGGTLGVMTLLGACGGACSLAVIPLGSLLTAMGLSGLVVFLPFLRWPLFGVALVLSFLVLRTVARGGKPVRVAGVAFLLGGSLAFAGFQAFKPSPCEALPGQQAGVRPEGLGEQGLFYDPEMSNGCEMVCAAHEKVDESRIVRQPGAKVGDLVRCPVSGVVFKVKLESPEVSYQGKTYFTCCATCAAKFQQKQKSMGRS